MTKLSLSLKDFFPYVEDPQLASDVFTVKRWKDVENKDETLNYL